MSFVTDTVVLIRLAAILKKASRNDLDPFWAPLVSRANQDAYNEVVRSLSLKGYDQSDIDFWGHGAEFQEAIALYFTLEYGGGLEEVERPIFEAMKMKREELCDVLVVDDDFLPMPPHVAGRGRVAFGEMDRSSGSLFLSPYGAAFPLSHRGAWKQF